MSWSKLNDSLNSVKGQINTFIQELVVPEDEDEESVERRESSEVGIEQLQEVCSAQENEVTYIGTALQWE